MSDKIVRHYDESKNPDGLFFGGIPLRDITEDEWEALDVRDQRNADAAPFYMKNKPRETTAPKDEPKKGDD